MSGVFRLRAGRPGWKWLACLVAASAFSVCAGQLPLNSVRYFNPYANPTNWSAGGTAIFQGNGTSVSNFNGSIPVMTVDGEKALVFDSINPPGGFWNVFFKVSGNPLNWLRVGTNPAIHLRLKWTAIPTNNAWNMRVRIENTDVFLNSYLTASTNAWQDIYIPASDFLAVNPNLNLTRIGAIVMLASGNYRDRCVLNISALDLVPSALPDQREYADFIKVNQVGYAPLMKTKLALVSWSTNNPVAPPASFQVVDATNNQVVFTGPLVKFVQGPNWPATDWVLAGDVIYQADFGALRAPGRYRVEVPELNASSPPFEISTNVYDRLLRDSLRFFYYSRNSVPIAEPHAEGFPRPALHTETTNASYNYDPNFGHYNFGANTTRDVHGCWFDAGDTHVDVRNTAAGCWFLLETLRDFGANVAPFSLNLPESNDQQGDLVPLITWALDWMKRMQNADGSVHTYVTGNPNTATQPQKVGDVSSFSTACALSGCIPI